MDRSLLQQTSDGRSQLSISLVPSEPKAAVELDDAVGAQQRQPLRSLSSHESLNRRPLSPRSRGGASVQARCSLGRESKSVPRTPPPKSSDVAPLPPASVYEVMIAEGGRSITPPLPLSRDAAAGGRLTSNVPFGGDTLSIAAVCSATPSTQPIVGLANKQTSGGGEGEARRSTSNRNDSVSAAASSAERLLGVRGALRLLRERLANAGSDGNNDAACDDNIAGGAEEQTYDRESDGRAQSVSRRKECVNDNGDADGSHLSKGGFGDAAVTESAASAQTAAPLGPASHVAALIHLRCLKAAAAPNPSRWGAASRSEVIGANVGSEAAPDVPEAEGACASSFPSSLLARKTGGLRLQPQPNAAPAAGRALAYGSGSEDSDAEGTSKRKARRAEQRPVTATAISARNAPCHVGVSSGRMASLPWATITAPPLTVYGGGLKAVRLPLVLPDPPIARAFGSRKTKEPKARENGVRRRVGASAAEVSAAGGDRHKKKKQQPSVVNVDVLTSSSDEEEDKAEEGEEEQKTGDAPSFASPVIAPSSPNGSNSVNALKDGVVVVGDVCLSSGGGGESSGSTTPPVVGSKGRAPAAEEVQRQDNEAYLPSLHDDWGNGKATTPSLPSLGDLSRALSSVLGKIAAAHGRAPSEAAVAAGQGEGEAPLLFTSMGANGTEGPSPPLVFADCGRFHGEGSPLLDPLSFLNAFLTPAAPSDDSDAVSSVAEASATAVTALVDAAAEWGAAHGRYHDRCVAERSRFAYYQRATAGTACEHVAATAAASSVADGAEARSPMVRSLAPIGKDDQRWWTAQEGRCVAVGGVHLLKAILVGLGGGVGEARDSTLS